MMNKNIWTWNLLSDGVIILMSVIAFIIVAVNVESSSLVNKPWELFKFYTVLSNVLVAICSLISFIHLLINREIYPVWLSTLKMVAATGIFITFITVMTYIGPLYGYFKMLMGANFFLHLLIPLSAIVEFIFFVPHRKAKFFTTTFGMLPVFLYGIFYLTNVSVNNGFGDINYDWYQFGHYGLGIGILMFAIILAIAYGLTCALFGLNRLVKINNPLI